MGEVAAIAAGARGSGQPLKKYSQKKMERVIVAEILDELGSKLLHPSGEEKQMLELEEQAPILAAEATAILLVIKQRTQSTDGLKGDHTSDLKFQVPAPDSPETRFSI
ncbi:hypothetical protein OIU84_018983 [Salix udensis]|uniref:Uncharacterized protein n=1 Tax=Salix udensis TaxID=889485 RepID=A0AAD6PKF6_9ROSI|nr:hypothetical protein OIU84_018983 [Salix udensis]